MSDRAVNQAKFHILNNCLPQVKPSDTRVIIPCTLNDLDAFKTALGLSEVKSAIAKTGAEVSAMPIRLPPGQIEQFFFPLIE